MDVLPEPARIADLRAFGIAIAEPAAPTGVGLDRDQADRLAGEHRFRDHRYAVSSHELLVGVVEQYRVADLVLLHPRDTAGTGGHLADDGPGLLRRARAADHDQAAF